MSQIPRRHFARALSGLALAAAAAASFAQTAPPLVSGKVFTATNSTLGNELLVIGRGADGGLELQARVHTQGAGTHAALGSQGAVTLSRDGRHVFVVNAGSHTVSTFTLSGNALALTSVVDSGGLTPVSVAERNGTVYVLNAGGAGNVAGFRNAQGLLQPIAGSVRGLSAAGGTAPAQVGFSTDGDVLVVSEKTTNRLTSYPVAADGSLGAAVVTPSAGATPFGFAFDNRDRLIVSEAAGGAVLGSSASSYRFSEQGGAVPALASAAVPTHQTAACWVAVTPDGRHAYTGNAGNSSLSLFRVGRDGGLALVQAAAGSTGPNAGVTDLATARDGQALFALAPRGLAVVAFDVASDGTLAPSSSVTGLPGPLAGLAAN